MMTDVGYLAVTFDKIETKEPAIPDLLPLPLANSKLFKAHVSDAVQLSSGEDVKLIFKLSLNTQKIDANFLPGDTIGIIPENDEFEVEEIIRALDLKDKANLTYKLSVLNGSGKKNAKLPTHIPENSSIKHVLMKYVDLRSVPKKLFLRTLLKYTTDTNDRQVLTKIIEDSNEYMRFISNKGRTLVGLLKTFPSCKPPVERLFEHLPPLKPRPYSISSSPLLENQIDIIFSLATFEDGTKGVCTNWLLKLIRKWQENETCIVPFYFRKPNSFRIVENGLPVVMIGAGTSVAPFLNFLETRFLVRKDEFAEAILFFGCRYSDTDYFCKSDLKRYLDSGILMNVFVSFSREQSEKIYVQHIIEENGKMLVDRIYNKSCSVFVCGATKGMAAGVRKAIGQILKEHTSMQSLDAEKYVENMIKEDKYKEDVWI